MSSLSFNKFIFLLQSEQRKYYFIMVIFFSKAVLDNIVDIKKEQI